MTRPSVAFASAWRRAGSGIREAARPWRLLIATKTAGAATGAWLLGHDIPGEAGNYAYFAPFGAIVAMTPTLVSSMRSAVRMVVSVTLGLLLEWGLLLGAAGPVAVALAIGIGTLIAGLPFLGEERMHVPLGAVFVFVAGGTDPDGFSVGYGLQLALGAAIGLAVNLLVPPGLGSRGADQAVDLLRESTAVRLSHAARLVASVVRSAGEDDDSCQRAYETLSARDVATTPGPGDPTAEHADIVAVTLRRVLDELAAADTARAFP